MKTMKTILSALAVLSLMAAGCGTDILGSDATTDTAKQDTPPACKATATTKQEACYELKDTLCERFLSKECETHASADECDKWFADDAGFGDCGTKSTDALPAGLQEGDFTTCICNIPTANCAALEDPGFDIAIPSCDSALTTMAGG